MTDDALLGFLHDAATAVHAALGTVGDWSPVTEREGQYAVDLVADAAALEVLLPAGLGVLSEESGVTGGEREVLVVLDPLDGSTNASQGLPWYATSLCALDGDGPVAAVVVDQARGTRFEATRGGGARRDGAPLRSSECERLADAVVGLSGYPARDYGWQQYRAYGAAALDLCAVAAGALDAYVDTGPGIHGPWDYLGGLLVCHEAGAVVVDGDGRDLLARDHRARRAPVAAATPSLLGELLTARRGAMDGDEPGHP